MSSRLKLIALNLRALAVGVLAASIFVTSFTYLVGWRAAVAANIDGAHLLIPLDVQVGLAAWFSLIYAVILASCCVPLWLLLVRGNLANAATAIALGFFATMALWIVINFPGHTIFPDLLASGFPYALCGAMAGLVTWWSRPRFSPPDRHLR